MTRYSLLFLLFPGFLAMAGVGVRAKPHSHAARAIQFSPDVSDLGDSGVRFLPREEWRIEHFLGAVFPVGQMRRYAKETGSAPDASFPDSRHVTYALISQQGFRFILVGYRAEWNEAEGRIQGVNELAIYRMEPDGPNQVWRSKPWQANYSGLHFRTAKYRAVKSGWRNVILFQEGGAEGEFGLASVFSFFNEPQGLFLHDLTPELPWLRAQERFPFRTLYGQSISFRLTEARELILTASDESFDLGMSRMVRPRRSWMFDKARGRFAPMKSFAEVTSRE